MEFTDMEMVVVWYLMYTILLYSGVNMKWHMSGIW